MSHLSRPAVEVPGGRAASSSAALGAARTCAAVAALAIAGKVSVPFWPVPMTLQSLALATVALGLGPRRGTAAVLAFLASGLAGLPVFADPSPAGPSHLLGPTGGYLLAMPFAAWGMASLHERRGGSFAWTVACALLGTALVLACGTVWLAIVPRDPSGAMGVGLDHAFSVGCRPFLVGDALKAVLAASLVRACPRRPRRI